MDASTLQDIFVGREHEQQLYHDFLTHDTPWVLIITGLGGIGKSTLLEHLAKDTSPAVCTCKLDFNETILRTEPLIVLQRLAQQIRLYGNTEQFDAFEQALHRDLDQLEQIRTIKLPPYTSGDANTQEGQPNTLDDDAATKEVGRQMRELSTESFYDLINTFHLNHLVLMLDTCEWFTEPEGWEAGQWVFNELIPELHNHLYQNDQRCSVAIVSRVKPQLERIDKQNQQYLPLSMLSEKAVYEYLERAGMHDPGLRQCFYDITHGHALSVSIIGTICQEQGEKSLAEEDFPFLQKEFTEKASMEFVDERILNRLKSPYRELTRYGVLLRIFNLPLLQAVFSDIDAIKGSDAPSIFDHLIRYPYIESRGNNNYAFHELLREVIADKVQQQDGPEKEQWKIYHKHALEYFSRIAPYSADWYYHAIASDEAQGMKDWLQVLQKASAPQTKALLQITYDSTLKLSPAACAIRDYEQGRFNYGSIEWLDATGNVQQARDKRKEALQNFENALKNFKEAKDSCGEALAEQAIDALQRPGKVQAAMLKSYWLVCLSPSVPLTPEPIVLPPSQEQMYASAPSAVAQLLPVQKQGLSTLSSRPLLLIALVVLALLIIAGGILSYGIGSFEKPQTSAPTPAQATATALANLAKANPNPYPPFAGILALYDPLRDNSAGYNWDVYSGKGEGCVFTGGAYHVLEQNANTLFSCAAGYLYTNFTYEVQMTIIKGDCGGMIFRADNIASKFYYFEVCKDGSYNLFLSVDSSGSNDKELATNTSPAIDKGLNQANLIAVVAYKSYLSLYVNKQFIAAISDTTYSSGEIGVFADNSSRSTEVKFYNARVWTLNRDPTTALLQSTYINATRGSPVFHDQLLSSSDPNNWDENDNCNFTGGAYHATVSIKNYLNWCVPNGIFSNFVFQVQMSIVNGDFGGMIFRANSTNTEFYYFTIGRDGSYSLNLYKGIGSEKQLLLLSGSIPPRIKTGLGQHVIIAVIAQGKVLNLFVNKQFIASISDNTYSSGGIGLIADDERNPTDVAFNDMQVWKL